MKIIEGYDVKIYTDNVEELALAQFKELLSIDVFSDKKIRIIPDVYAGVGCVIGFVGDCYAKNYSLTHREEFCDKKTSCGTK